MHQHAAQIDRRGFIAGAAAATALAAAAPLASKAHADEAGRPASMYVAEREFEYTARGLGEGVMPGADDLNAMYGVPLRWQLVPEDVAEVELLPGITIHNFGIGHSFGMLGLMVELPETGNVLMPSDACCYLANLDKENRLLPPERVTDYERTVAAFDVISDLAEKNNAQVWPAHDPAWFSTMTLASEGYYA